jgi:formylglycine-generating enzyme required for sulfatase activity
MDGDGGADATNEAADVTRLDATDAGPGDAADSGDGGALLDALWVSAAGDAFQIMAHEVTNDEYTAFLDLLPDLDAQAPPCAAINTTFIPAGFPPPEDGGTLPVVNVDWCDARMYCALSGARLCGAIGGGPLQLSDVGGPVDAWYTACSQGRRLVFPYGNTYQPTWCNGQDRTGAPGAVVPVGSLSTCEGGYPGIFDMSGNVWEWTDACDEDAGQCVFRGGSCFDQGDTRLACSAVPTAARLIVYPNLGFRCCR